MCVQNLGFSYGGAPVLSDVSFTLERGEFLSVLGPNGVGKSTLLSTHNPQHALTFATRILALSGGRVAALGAPQDVLTGELIERLYGVRAALADTPGGCVIVPVMDAPDGEGRA